jgi:ABC-type transport system involved in cytochrome bd biosynthesis fused ATPase/permease subunit
MSNRTKVIPPKEKEVIMDTTVGKNQRRKKVHIVLSGPSGQCGKSTFTRIMLERAKEKREELILVNIAALAWVKYFIPIQQIFRR